MNVLTYRWYYHDASGNLVGYVLRFDKPEGKVVIPHFVADGAGGFGQGALPAPRPLYGLGSLLAAADMPVFIVEGEKCAAALHGLGFPAVCSLGGSNAPHLTDWKPVANHRGDTYLLPDNDEAGEKYAQAVAGLLNHRELRIVRLAGLPPKGDVVDWLQAMFPGWNGFQPLPKDCDLDSARSKLLAACRECGVPYAARGGDNVRLAIETPTPLLATPSEGQSFPVDALGPILYPVAVAIHEVVKAPMAMCAQSVLAAATLAVQGYADIGLPNGQRRPISNFFLSLADSGERKTACDIEALKPVRAREKELAQQRESGMTLWRNKRDIHEQGRKTALNVKEPEKRSEELYRLGEEPQPPLESLLTCPEPTYEGLCRLLAEGQPSMGIFSSEGGQFFGGHGMNDDNRLRNITGYSNLWDGGSIRSVRKGDGARVLDGRRLAIHLMIQPDVARPYLSNELFLEQGFFSRFLISWPVSTMGTRYFSEPSADNIASLARYNDWLGGILKVPPPLADGQRNELAPSLLTLSHEAKALWIAFHDECERRLADGGEYREIRGFSNKLPEHALRLAGVLTLVGDIHAREVEVQAVENGIKLARYYAGEALRLADVRLADATTLAAEAVRKWLIESWKEVCVSVPDIQNGGPRLVRGSSEKCKKVVAMLVQNGWLVAIEGGALIAGKNRKCPLTQAF